MPETVRQAHQIYVFERLPHHLVLSGIRPDFILRIGLLWAVWMLLPRFSREAAEKGSGSSLAVGWTPGGTKPGGCFGKTTPFAGAQERATFFRPRQGVWAHPREAGMHRPPTISSVGCGRLSGPRW